MPPAVFVGKESMRETDPWLTGGASAAPAAAPVVPTTAPAPIPEGPIIGDEVQTEPEFDVYAVDDLDSETE